MQKKTFHQITTTFVLGKGHKFIQWLTSFTRSC